MNVPFDWNKFDEDTKKEILKNTKSGSIAFIKDRNELKNWEICHAHWETFLTSDYWKNWQEKIKSFQTAEEVNFYTNRLRAVMDFIHDNTRKDIRYVENAKPWDSFNTPKLIEQELKRLQNISQTDWEKADKFANIGLRELSFKEISNDKWFNDKIDEIFGIDRKVKTDKSSKTQDDKGYNSDDSKDLEVEFSNLTKEQLIEEIKRLKAKLQKEKNKNNSENSQKLETQLQKAESVLNLQNSNSNLSPNSPSNFLVKVAICGGISLVLLIGLIAYKVRKNQIKK